MYCLRSFAVLLFLPVPWTPPLFSFLFLITFYLQKRPCIYCTILLVGVYASTCYWNLAPLSETLSSSTIASNTTLSAVSDTISACWCDLNGGALLKPRVLLKSTAPANCSTFAVKPIDGLPLENAVKDLPPVRWLSNAIERVSSGFTESLLGIKLTL